MNIIIPLGIYADRWRGDCFFCRFFHHESLVGTVCYTDKYPCMDLFVYSLCASLSDRPLRGLASIQGKHRESGGGIKNYELGIKNDDFCIIQLVVFINKFCCHKNNHYFCQRVN